MLRTHRGNRRRYQECRYTTAHCLSNSRARVMFSATAVAHLACRPRVDFLSVVPVWLGTSSAFANLRASDIPKITYLMVHVPFPFISS